MVTAGLACAPLEEKTAAAKTQRPTAAGIMCAFDVVAKRPTNQTKPPATKSSLISAPELAVLMLVSGNNDCKNI